MFALLKTSLSVLKPEIILSLKVFILGIIFGAFYTLFFIKDLEQIRSFFELSYQEILEQGKGAGFLTWWYLIFKRNLTAAIITILLGLIYRYLPLVIITFNSLMIGLFSLSIILFTNQALDLLNLLPHGIFEIPAIIIASAWGISLARLSNQQGIKGKIKALSDNWTFLILIGGLLLLAAAIESLLITLNTSSQ